MINRPVISVVAVNSVNNTPLPSNNIPHNNIQPSNIPLNHFLYNNGQYSDIQHSHLHNNQHISLHNNQDNSHINQHNYLNNQDNSHNNYQNNNQSKTTPRIFKRLFSKKATQQDQGMQTNVIPSNYCLSATTFLQLNPLSHPHTHIMHVNQHTNQSPVLLDSKDLCSKCHINPSTLSIANSKGMTAEKLCFSCHILSQQPVNSRLQKVEAADKYTCRNEEVGNNPENGQTTVIVMQANKATGLQSITETDKSLTNKISVVLPYHSNYSRMETQRESPKEQVYSGSDRAVVSKLSFQPSFRKGDSRPNFEGRIVSNEVNNLNTPSAEISYLPITEDLFPNNEHQVITSNHTDEPFEQDATNNFSNRSTDLFFSQNPSDRPLAFNPDFRGTLRGQQIDLPAELESTAPIQFSGKFQEMRHNELQEHHRILNSPNQLPSYSAPPRYEDIVNDPPPPPPQQHQQQKQSTLGTYSLQPVNSFGKSCTQAQPGAFKQPTFIKFSSNHEGTDGVLVVTDPSLNIIQIFDPLGNCQAMVRVEGLVCACATTNSTLLVACEDKVALMRSDGSEKASLSIETSDQNNVKAVVRFRSDAAFAVLAQRKKVSVLDCGHQSVRVLRAFETASSRRRLLDVADVAMTRKDDLVILDAGDNDVSIYVIDTTSGQLKSAISAKHESCGPIRAPSSVSLDRFNRIIVAEPSEKRVLMFSAQAPQKEKTKSKVLVRKLASLKDGETPLGVAVGVSDVCFILTKKEQGIVVSSFRHDEGNHV